MTTPVDEQSNPTVSVLIAAYNAMEYLPETVESVLNQTYTDFELIIVDDGSTDCIADWVKQIEDRRLRFVSQPNKGLAAARNEGLKHARGELIAFLDADDLWRPAKLAMQVERMVANPKVGVVYNWVAIIDEHGALQGKVRKSNAEGNVWGQLTTGNIVECGSVALVRRECFAKVGSFDEDLPCSCSEDWDMWLRIATSYEFAVIKEVLTLYRCHSNSLSRRWQIMDESFEIVLKKAFAGAPESLRGSKERSFAFAKLRTAWKALQNSNGDSGEALRNERIALNFDPSIRFTREYVRFKIAYMMVSAFGLEGYNRCRREFYRLPALLTSKLG
jgi:glycosyltransferase involved in cell wall biosynthesis